MLLINIEDYTEEKINMAILCVLCKLPIIDFELVVKTLVKEELNEENKYLKNIEKYGDLNSLWKLVENKYGYTLD